MDMANHLSFLDKFVKQMKKKIIDCSIKYCEEDVFTLETVKKHLIDEICKLFNLHRIRKRVFRDIFKNKSIDDNELIDVANMCWIYKFIKERENEL